MTALRITTADLAPIQAAVIARPGVLIVVLDQRLTPAERRRALLQVAEGGPHHAADLLHDLTAGVQPPPSGPAR